MRKCEHILKLDREKSLYIFRCIRCNIMYATLKTHEAEALKKEFKTITG